MKAAKYYKDPKDRRTFDLALYAKDHPNKLNRNGRSWIGELADCIADQNARFGFDRPRNTLKVTIMEDK